MRISGFTIVRETVRLGYPFVESIRSLLPLVDEIVVGVGDGGDGTWEAVAAIGDERIVAFRSNWDLANRGFGRELAVQTNRALERCSGDWAVYLQADEVLHEDDVEPLRERLVRHRSRRTEGLVFRHLHFYGRYDAVADDWRRFYPRAVRAVRTGLGIESVGDGCGFHRRRPPGSRGLLKAEAGARIFHYGRCGPPEAVRAKILNLERFYDRQGKPAGALAAREGDAFPLPGTPLRRFSGTHPAVMSARIAAGGAALDPPPADRPAAPVRRALVALAAVLDGSVDVRPLVPLPISNAGWRALDGWRALAGRRRR